MSIRAHRVIEVKTSGESFNLWHDKEIIDWLIGHTNFFISLNHDCCGHTEISLEDLKLMLSEIGEAIDKGVREAIEKDIKNAEENGDEYVAYYCY